MDNIIDNKMLNSLKMNGHFDFGFERIMKVENKS